MSLLDEKVEDQGAFVIAVVIVVDGRKRHVFLRKLVIQYGAVVLEPAVMPPAIPMK